MEIPWPSGQCRMMSGAERAESSDSASKSIRHSTSQELQWKNSVPFMVHCRSSQFNVSRFPTDPDARFVSWILASEVTKWHRCTVEYQVLCNPLVSAEVKTPPFAGMDAKSGPSFDSKKKITYRSAETPTLLCHDGSRSRGACDSPSQSRSRLESLGSSSASLGPSPQSSHPARKSPVCRGLLFRLTL